MSKKRYIKFVRFLVALRGVLYLYLELVVFVNLVLSAFISAICFFELKKGGARLLRDVGIAFGLFAVTHAANILNASAVIGDLPTVIVRVLAYAVILHAVVRESRILKVIK